MIEAVIREAIDADSPWRLGEQSELLRRRLRERGWVEWDERHERDGSLVTHAVHMYTADHERGPLIVWMHPGRCTCLEPSTL